MAKKLALIVVPISQISLHDGMVLEEESKEILWEMGYEADCPYYIWNDLRSGGLEYIEWISSKIRLYDFGYYNLVYFAKGWHEDKSCNILHKICEDFNIEFICHN